MVEDGWIWFKIIIKEKALGDISSKCCLEQAEEISRLRLGVELCVLIRAEAGRVELVRVSDPDDVVEEAEERGDG